MEIKVTKKMGRPPVNTRAMSSAERQQRYRDRIKREAHELALLIRKNNETLL